MFGVADVYIGLIIFLTILVSFPALLIALNLLWPTYCRHTAARLTTSPGKSFGVGLIIVASLGVLAAVAGNVGPPLVLLVGLVGLALGTVGAAGTALALADRLADWHDSPSRLAQLVRGAVVFEMAGLVPLVGWFLFTPLAGTAGIGAAVLARFGRHRQPDTDSRPVSDEPIRIDPAGSP